MTLLLLGFDHRTAPVDLLEAMAVSADRAPKALASLLDREHVEEAAVLSTCNRVEIYAKVSRFHDGVAEVRDHLAEWAGVDPATTFHVAYETFDRDAARHLFAVAGGLESMVVGERQIHGQVKDAFALALAEGAIGPVLNRVFRQAIRVGKRTRAETDLDRGARSIVDLALRVAREELATDSPEVLTVGAGKICGMAARDMASSARRVVVTNRTAEKAHRLRDRLAEQVPAMAAGLQAVPELLGDADLVICSTDASRPLLSADVVLEAMARRPSRPMVIIDLAVPRDVEAGVRDVPGVAVIDIASLRGVVTTGPTADALQQARVIVEEEADGFASWSRGVAVGPTVAALRLRAEEIRAQEIDRLSGRLASLDAAQRQAVEALTRGIVNTLLHEPTVRLKASADSGHGTAHAATLSHLFGLAAATHDDDGLDDN